MKDEASLKSSVLKVSASIDAVYELVMEKGWGDGLPVIPPTDDRIYEMLKTVKGNPSKVLGHMPPSAGEVTLEKLAINAVMAGCLPEYFPVIVAAVEAMLEPQFNLLGIQPTTNPVGPALLINGPIRNKLNINCLRGCLGPGWRANATIGRAIRLILINIGGGLPGEIDKAVHGMPGKYTFCFGEDEEGSPWTPLQVDRGFSREDSTVTVMGVAGTHNSLYINPLAHVVLKFTAQAMSLMGCNDMMFPTGEPVVVMTAAHADLLVKAGFSKADVKRALYEYSGVPVSQYPEEVPKERNLGVIDGMVKPCQSPEDIIVIIAGGRNPYHTVAMPTLGTDKSVTKLIRDSIELQ